MIGNQDPIREACAWLEDQSEQQDVLDGVQLSIIPPGGEPWHFVAGRDGFGRPMQVDTLGQLRCGVAKPISALVVASLVGEGKLNWSTTVGDVLDLPMHPEMALNTVDDLICHRAGAHFPPALFLNIQDPKRRLGMALETAPPDGWRRGIDSQYSDSCGLLVLGKMIESVTGQPYEQVAVERVMQPSGISPADLQYRMTPESFRESVDRIGVCATKLGAMRVPYVIEATELMATEWNPSWSGYATARGLAELYRYILDLTTGRTTNPYLSQSALDDMMWARPYEPGGKHLTEEALMGRGLLFDLRIAKVPAKYSKNTFGHFGYGIAMGFADQALDVAVAMRFTNHNDDAIHLMRTDRIVTAIYEAFTGEQFLV